MKTRLLAACALSLLLNAAHAADPEPARPPVAVDRLAPARAQIANGQWVAAMAELKKLNDTGSADWNNLMGYSHRKAKTPDYPAADRYYTEALRIDPRHRGALEYSGELYLMTGELPRAEQRLAALAQACNSRCEEFDDLKKAVERYKANGNKYVPGS